MNEWISATQLWHPCTLLPACISHPAVMCWIVSGVFSAPAPRILHDVVDLLLLLLMSSRWLAFPDIGYFLNLAVVHIMRGLVLPWCLQNRNPIGYSLSTLSLWCTVLTDLICFILDSGSSLSSSCFSFSRLLRTCFRLMAVTDLLVASSRFPKDPKVLVTLISVMLPANEYH